MQESTKFNGKARRWHINMPDIDREHRILILAHEIASGTPLRFQI